MHSHGWTGVGLVMLVFHGVLAAQESESALGKARKTIAPRLFQVVCGNERGGTAYLLKVSKETQGTRAYFATCYHVLHRMSQADLYAADDQAGEPFAEFKVGRGEAYAVPERDLVLLRVAVVGGEQPLTASSQEAEQSDGFAFGFPSFQRSHSFDLNVRITSGVQPAKLLGILKDNGEREMALRFLGNEISYPGMSGGPVLDAQHRYAGMLLGRMPEPAAVPVMLPARQVLEQLEKVEQLEKNQAGSGWRPFSNALFQRELPYAESFSKYLAQPYLISDQDWTSFERWTAALGPDATPFLRSFQEISVDHGVLKSVRRQRQDDSLTFEAANDYLAPGEDAKRHRLEFRLNGKSIDPGENASLLPGENLLIITKQVDSSGHFLLNDFFRANPLAAEIRMGGDTVFLIKRSLPAIIQRYMVFVTIHNGNLIEQSAADVCSARLAVRLDYLNQVLNAAPFRLPIQGGDPEHGTHFYDLDATAKGEYLRLRYVSPQSLDVVIQGQMEVRKLLGRFGGIKAQFPPAGKPPWNYGLSIGGRVQFPAGPGQDQLFFVSPRAHGADSLQPIPLPLLGNDLEVDAGPALREALVCYVNRELLIPDKAALAGSDSVSKVLEQAGLLSPLGDYALRPHRIFLAHDDSQARTWVIVTFQLLDKDRQVVRPPSMPPTIPPHGTSAGIDFDGRGLPMSAGQVHFSPPKANGTPNLLAGQLTARDDSTMIWANRIHVEFAVPDALPLAPSGEPAQLSAKGEQLGAVVGDLLKTAFRDTPKKLEAVLPASALVRLASRLPLGRGLLGTPHDAEGSLGAVVTARRNKARLEIGGSQGFSLSWKQPLDFGVARANALRFSLDKIQLTGDLQEAAVVGRLEGSLQARSIALDKDEFLNPQITFIANIDSRKKEQLELSLTASADEWRKADMSKISKLNKQIKIAAGTATTADELRQKVIRALVDSVLFKNDCCSAADDKAEVPCEPRN